MVKEIVVVPPPAQLTVIGLVTGPGKTPKPPVGPVHPLTESCWPERFTPLNELQGV